MVVVEQGSLEDSFFYYLVLCTYNITTLEEKKQRLEDLVSFFTAKDLSCLKYPLDLERLFNMVKEFS